VTRQPARRANSRCDSLPCGPPARRWQMPGTSDSACEVGRMAGGHQRLYRAQHAASSATALVSRVPDGYATGEQAAAGLRDRGGHAHRGRVVSAPTERAVSAPRETGRGLAAIAWPAAPRRSQSDDTAPPAGLRPLSVTQRGAVLVRFWPPSHRAEQRELPANTGYGYQPFPTAAHPSGTQGPLVSLPIRNG
jgi:hypothetical protein